MHYYINVPYNYCRYKYKHGGLRAEGVVGVGLREQDKQDEYPFIASNQVADREN